MKREQRGLVRTNKKQPGFTLIEVIISLALFAVSVTGLTQSFTNGLLCKTKLPKGNNDEAFCLQLIRTQLMQLKREEIEQTHTFCLPDNKTQIGWSGKVAFCRVMSLYRVAVQIRDNKDRKNEFFFVHRPDWMTNEEKAAVSPQKGS